MTTHVDPITLELIKGMMRSARAEMEALIERTAMSPFIREKKDYFTAFFTRDGRMLFGTNLPLGGNLLDAILRSILPRPYSLAISTGTTTATVRVGACRILRTWSLWRPSFTITSSWGLQRPGAMWTSGA